MGAEQSTPRGGNQAAVVRKTCYYELLGVDRQAPDEEIRRAYKKKALELHPDRNLNDTENATKRFAEAQTAYEILSDPQERAWYDSHRDAILNGEDDVAGTAPTDQSGSGHTSANAIFALMSRFSSSVPMDDSTRGFFGILNAFFDQLAAEENAACEYAGMVPTEYPPFGGASDDYNAVGKRFYSVWSGFSTKKTFSWRDKYRLQDAPDRQIRRLMQKENQKLRDEGIREFNDAVRSLVAFVRKRDPRYVPNKQSEEERQQVLRNSTAAQAARSRAANQQKLAEYVLPEWAQSRDNDEDHGEFSLSEEDDEVEEIECVVCNKTFKSEKQFDTHEKSKKHVKAVQQLRRQMKKENANLDLQDSEPVMSLSQTAHGQPGEDDTPGSAASAHYGEHDGQVEDARSITGEEDTNLGTPSQPDSEDDDYAPRSEVEERIVNGPHTETKSTNTRLSTPDATDSAPAGLDGLILGNGKDEGKKVGKAKLRREKKAARHAAEAQTSHKCAVCDESFTSRTKLFAHIKDNPTHAAPVPVSSAKAAKKKRR